MPDRLITYREFWPCYLREHARPTTRSIHFLGTVIATASLVAFIITGNPWLFAAVLLGGYGPAWFAHFLIEHNKPATFRHPIWSLVSDYRMAFVWLTGQLDRELLKAGVKPR